MKSIFLVYLLYPILFFNFSHPPEDELDLARVLVRKVDSELDRYEKTSFTCIDLNSDSIKANNSMEGAELYGTIGTDLVKYYHHNELIKIEVMFKGTHEHIKSEYYFNANELVFARNIKTVYHKSMYHPNFDPSDKSVRNEYFYFIDENLVRWVNADIIVEQEWKPEFSENEFKILHDVTIYRNYQDS